MPEVASSKDKPEGLNGPDGLDAQAVYYEELNGLVSSINDTKRSV